MSNEIRIPKSASLPSSENAKRLAKSVESLHSGSIPAGELIPPFFAQATLEDLRRPIMWGELAPRPPETRWQRIRRRIRHRWWAIRRRVAGVIFPELYDLEHRADE